GPPPDPAAGVPAHLRQRLAAEADAGGLLDVAYRTVDSPIGALLLAATPAGVVRIGFECEGHDAVLAGLAGRVSPRILHAPARLDPAARQLEEYFAGARRSFDLPLDLRLASPFRRAVVAHLASIPYGATATYAAVAAGVGNPAAVRAVGSACATNPVPVVLPCHRVVRSDGGIGGYLGGPAAKAALLALERRAW
ncbi:MAG TPA: methylated-DNA--[protein]-cysteine S-methyltransferase, partial [Acidimicrobiales bacterium]|nr:methylated-DNA--[protein]-cysteine S-methyltransferase [Acidimicrobiales bacterium]